jgi:hypothetical protein
VAHRVSFDGPILVISLHGTVTETDLDAVADAVLGIEHGGTIAPPRLTDLRGITEAAFGYQEMARLADRVKERPLELPVRSAILVSQPVQLGFARMFQILNTHPQVTLRIFEDEASAHEWLAGASLD